MRHIEVLGGDAKVGFCSGLNAKRAAAERHNVEIARQNFVLTQSLLQVRCHAHFTYFARIARLGGGDLLGLVFGINQKQVVLHILLVDGGCTLFHGAGEHVGGHGSDGSLPVHAFVLVEATIFDADNGLLHHW